MRIIAGKYKGRLIQFPKHIRPTQDKVRQSIFDCLAGAFEGAKVLDLFAGSGALGIEALSRGAAYVYFIDNDRRCSLVIDKNLQRLNVGEDETCVHNFTNDAFRAIKILEDRKVRFDIVFLDPPYYKEVAKKALKWLSGSGILPPRSFVIVEHSRKDDLGVVPDRLRLVKELSTGDVKVSVFAIGE